MTPEQQAAVDFLSAALGDLPNPRVLVVDDNRDDLELNLRVLSKFRCEIITASSADQAVKLIEEDGIDLIFLDAVLPKNPADDVVAVAAGLMPDASIVVVTGYPDSAVKSAAIKAGAKLILTKPLTEELVSSILHRKAT